ncbi:MAG: LLM class flavin-dependent oxidoreductase [Omnitrophica WOR_2 bacterium]
MKIGFVIVIAEHPVYKRALSYQKIRQMARWGEKAGFDSVWLYDHLLYRNEGRTIGIWECWTILSALADATKKIELGTLVNCNLFRNPAILAKMAATLDEVSGGRLILGLGAGWNQAEFDAFGIPNDHRASRFEEALQIICPLLREGHVDFSGKYYQAKDCLIAPRGPRPSGPPILVGTGGERMLRLTAHYADLWNTAYMGKPESFEKPLQAFHQACTDVGRSPQSIGATALLYLAIPDLVPPGAYDAEALTGSVEEIAEAIAGYEKMGAEHLMFHTIPYNQKALDRLAQAMKLYREKV